MTATVQKKSDKYYIVLSWQQNGKQKLKWVSTGISTSGNHKREVERMRMQVLAEWEQKIAENAYAAEGILFSDYMLEWLEQSRSTISTNTYYAYKQTVEKSICPWFAERRIKLQDLKPYHLQEFYNYKLQTVSANSVIHYHANIHKALNYAVKMERIPNNPADKVTLPKKEKHTAEYYTEDELKILLDKVTGHPLETVVLLAAFFGLRRGEIIGLKWEAIDFNNKTLSVIGTMKDKGESGSKLKNMRYESTAKTNSSLRSLPMNDWIVDYLRKLKDEQDERRNRIINYNHAWDEFVCVRPNGDILPMEYVSRTFPKLCTECGLKRITLHELRHTNISLLLEKGASMKELQLWAGHSNYSTTANIYSHISAKNMVKLSQSLETIH